MRVKYLAIVIAVIGCMVIIAAIASQYLASPRVTSQRIGAPVRNAANQVPTALQISETSVSPPHGLAAFESAAKPPTGKVSAAKPKGSSFAIRGRFLLPDGIPASGVKVELRIPDDEPPSGHDNEFSESNVTAASNSSGGFEISLDQNPRGRLSLAASRRGFAQMSWSWDSIQNEKLTDLGIITLVASGDIRGRVIDQSGGAPPLDLRVYAQSFLQPNGTAANPFCQSVAVGASSGEFRINDVPPGKVLLFAKSAAIGVIDGPSMVVHSDQDNVATITYNGTKASTSIVAVTSNLALPFFANPRAGSLVLEGKGGGRCIGQKVGNDLSSSWIFEGLTEKRYSLLLTDDRFLPCTLSEIDPGQKLWVPLVGSAALLLKVDDPENGTAINQFEVILRYPAEGSGKMRLKGEPNAHGTRIAGVVPGSMELTVSANGYEEISFAVNDLAACEQRFLVVALTKKP